MKGRLSEESLAVALSSIDAYNAGDLDAQMATYLPTAVAITHINAETRLPDVDNRLEGRAAIRRWVSEGQEFWRARYEPSEVQVLRNGAVLCWGRWGGVGVATGIELYIDTTVLFRIRDGLIERVEFFDDHDRALKAVGLAE